MSTPDDQRKRPTDAGGEPPLKRRLVSEHDRFFAGLPDGQLCSEQKVLKFPERIADGDIKTIFQRECQWASFAGPFVQIFSAPTTTRIQTKDSL